MWGHKPRVTMLTFAPTLDTEQARLALDYYGIAYRERDHLVPWAMLMTRGHGGTGKVPLVYGRGVAASGPREIAAHYDSPLPEELKLVPTEAAAAAQFEADWALTNGTMSGGTAIFAYYHLLPERRLMAPIFAAPTSWPERLTMPLFYPLMRKMIAAQLKLSPEAAEAARGKILSSFDETDRRVADGRLYLNGDERMTLADIALAAAAAPLLLPKGFGTVLPTADQSPPELAQLMRSLAARPTARFVQRLYSEGVPKARARREAGAGG
ncbi:MAG TPA: glutathione S-transferase C-terminal domain-containing protein [Allosphingosinicella sp.]